MANPMGRPAPITFSREKAERLVRSCRARWISPNTIEFLPIGRSPKNVDKIQEPLPDHKLCFGCHQLKETGEFKSCSSQCNDCAKEAHVRLARLNHNLRAVRIAFSELHHTDNEWVILLHACEGKCLKCGSTERLSRDHIQPLVCGGSDGIENIQPLCLRCNLSKHTKTVDYRPEWIRNYFTAESG